MPSLSIERTISCFPGRWPSFIHCWKVMMALFKLCFSFTNTTEFTFDLTMRHLVKSSGIENARNWDLIAESSSQVGLPDCPDLQGATLQWVCNHCRTTHPLQRLEQINHPRGTLTFLQYLFEQELCMTEVGTKNVNLTLTWSEKSDIKRPHNQHKTECSNFYYHNFVDLTPFGREKITIENSDNNGTCPLKCIAIEVPVDFFAVHSV